MTPRDTAYRPLDRPFFGTSAKIAAFTGVFLVSLAVQAGAIWTIYATSRRAVTSALGHELSTIAESAAASAAASLKRHADAREVGSMLWRAQQSDRLEYALIVDEDGGIIANSWGGAAGRAASVLTVTPAVVRTAVAEGRPAREELTLLGEPFLRTYWPVRWDGRTRGVLCVDAHDRLPEGLTALELPLAFGLGVSLLTALALGAVVVALMRFLDRSKRELVRMERLATAGTLAASLAHEVKNPMSTILSASELLEGAENITRDQREMLTDIREEVVRIDDHLDAFLDITREMPLRVKNEDLREIVSRTVAILRKRANESGVLLEACVTDAPVIVSVDRRRLRQALVNLILNGIEACTGRPGTVSVGMHLEPADGRAGTQAVVLIRDDGLGFTPEVLEHAWEPFFTTKATGTGLGLPGARQVVERHGGALTLEPAPGKGTIARITLPVTAGGTPDENTDR